MSRAHGPRGMRREFAGERMGTDASLGGNLTVNRPLRASTSSRAFGDGASASTASSRRRSAYGGTGGGLHRSASSTSMGAMRRQSAHGGGVAGGVAGGSRSTGGAVGSGMAGVQFLGMANMDAQYYNAAMNQRASVQENMHAMARQGAMEPEAASRGMLAGGGGGGGGGQLPPRRGLQRAPSMHSVGAARRSGAESMAMDDLRERQQTIEMLRRQNEALSRRLSHQDMSLNLGAMRSGVFGGMQPQPQPRMPMSARAPMGYHDTGGGMPQRMPMLPRRDSSLRSMISDEDDDGRTGSGGRGSPMVGRHLGIDLDLDPNAQLINSPLRGAPAWEGRVDEVREAYRRKRLDKLKDIEAERHERENAAARKVDRKYDGLVDKLTREFAKKEKEKIGKMDDMQREVDAMADQFSEAKNELRGAIEMEESEAQQTARRDFLSQMKTSGMFKERHNAKVTKAMEDEFKQINVRFQRERAKRATRLEAEFDQRGKKLKKQLERVQKDLTHLRQKREVKEETFQRKRDSEMNRAMEDLAREFDDREDALHDELDQLDQLTMDDLWAEYVADRPHEASGANVSDLSDDEPAIKPRMMRRSSSSSMLLAEWAEKKRETRDKLDRLHAEHDELSERRRRVRHPGDNDFSDEELRSGSGLSSEAASSDAGDDTAAAAAAAAAGAGGDAKDGDAPPPVSARRRRRWSDSSESDGSGSEYENVLSKQNREAEERREVEEAAARGFALTLPAHGSDSDGDGDGTGEGSGAPKVSPLRRLRDEFSESRTLSRVGSVPAAAMRNSARASRSPHRHTLSRRQITPRDGSMSARSVLGDGGIRSERRRLQLLQETMHVKVVRTREMFDGAFTEVMAALEQAQADVLTTTDSTVATIKATKFPHSVRDAQLAEAADDGEDGEEEVVVEEKAVEKKEEEKAEEGEAAKSKGAAALAGQFEAELNDILEEMEGVERDNTKLFGDLRTTCATVVVVDDEGNVAAKEEEEKEVGGPLERFEKEIEGAVAHMLKTAKELHKDYVTRGKEQMGSVRVMGTEFEHMLTHWTDKETARVEECRARLVRMVGHERETWEGSLGDLIEHAQALKTKQEEKFAALEDVASGLKKVVDLLKDDSPLDEVEGATNRTGKLQGQHAEAVALAAHHEDLLRDLVRRANALAKQVQERMAREVDRVVNLLQHEGTERVEAYQKEKDWKMAQLEFKMDGFHTLWGDYANLVDDFKGVINVFATLHEEASKMADMLAAPMSQAEASNAAVEGVQAEVEALRAQLADAQAQHADALAAAEARVAEAEEAKAVVEEQLDTALDRMASETSTAAGATVELESEVATWKGRAESLQARVAELEAAAAAKDDVADGVVESVARLEAQLVAQERATAEQNDEMERLRGKLRAMEEEVDEVMEREEVALQRAEEMRAELTELRAEKDAGKKEAAPVSNGTSAGNAVASPASVARVRMLEDAMEAQKNSFETQMKKMVQEMEKVVAVAQQGESDATRQLGKVRELMTAKEREWKLRSEGQLNELTKVVKEAEARRADQQTKMHDLKRQVDMYQHKVSALQQELEEKASGAAATSSKLPPAGAGKKKKATITKTTSSSSTGSPSSSPTSRGGHHRASSSAASSGRGGHHRSPSAGRLAPYNPSSSASASSSSSSDAKVLVKKKKKKKHSTGVSIKKVIK